MNVQDVVMQRLALNGWVADRPTANTAIKKYQTPSDAVARLTYDKECEQYWLNGEYTSAGVQELSGCFACIPASSEVASIEAKVDIFCVEADSRVEKSFAGRFLRGQRKNCNAALRCRWAFACES